MEWTRAFGLMFEEWLREVVDMAEIPKVAGTVLLPSHPGAADEIEDVVLFEKRGAVLFSGKSKMTRENVARQAQSRSKLIDWYEDFFFEPESKQFSAGAVRLLSANIDRIRAGDHEPRMPRGTRLYPVLVSYDLLCEDVLLYEWIQARCQALGLLQQTAVAPLTIANIEEFEMLMFHAGEGKSVVSLLRDREGRWANRRLDVQLRSELVQRKRAPRLASRFDEIVNGMGLRLFGRKIR